MNRELILIRHTKSSWADLQMRDFDRPLKQDRIADAINMGRHLSQIGLSPDLILCSPAIRTKQTAALLCSQLAYDYNKVEFDLRLYESTAKDYLQAVRETEASIRQLVVIGHNPSITHFANMFLKHAVQEMSTTAVVWIQFESPDWEIYSTTSNRLKCFLTPKTL